MFYGMVKAAPCFLRSASPHYRRFAPPSAAQKSRHIVESYTIHLETANAGKEKTTSHKRITLNKKAGSYLLSRVCSIIGARELDFRVRNGNGYYLSAMATGI